MKGTLTNLKFASMILTAITIHCIALVPASLAAPAAAPTPRLAGRPHWNPLWGIGPVIPPSGLLDNVPVTNTDSESSDPPPPKNLNADESGNSDSGEDDNTPNSGEGPTESSRKSKNRDEGGNWGTDGNTENGPAANNLGGGRGGILNNDVI